MQKVLNNSKGFSLLQIMIMAAALGALSYVGLKISKNTNKTTAKTQFDYDVNLATNEISEILSDPAVCQAIFGGNTTPDNINGRYYTKTSGMAPLTTGYKNSHFNVTSYTLSGAAPSGKLTILFENPNVSKSSTTTYVDLSKQIDIYFQGTLGAISTCRSLSKLEDTDIWLRARPTSNIYYDANYVGIFTTDPQYRLEVIGEIRTTTYARAAAFFATSDKKLKMNIRPIKSSLENFDKLKGITYDWNETALQNGVKDDSRQIGLFAQDVEKVFPEAVKNSKEGFKAVNYQALVGPMVEGVKTLKNQNKKENSELENLRAENEEMKAWVCSQDKSAPFCN